MIGWLYFLLALIGGVGCWGIYRYAIQEGIVIGREEIDEEYKAEWRKLKEDARQEKEKQKSLTKSLTLARITDDIEKVREICLETIQGRLKRKISDSEEKELRYWVQAFQQQRNMYDQQASMAHQQAAQGMYNRFPWEGGSDIKTQEDYLRQILGGLFKKY